MHVLLLAAEAALADDLAAAWRSNAAGTVTAAETPPWSAAPAPRGVFVPVSALGLSRQVPAGPVEVAVRGLLAGTDVVVLHVDVLDGTSLHDGVLPVISRLAVERGVPVVVLAGRVLVSRREWSTGGVSGVHEVGDAPDDRARIVARVGGTWAPAWASAPESPVGA